MEDNFVKVKNVTYYLVYWKQVCKKKSIKGHYRDEKLEISEELSSAAKQNVLHQKSSRKIFRVPSFSAYTHYSQKNWNLKLDKQIHTQKNKETTNNVMVFGVIEPHHNWSCGRYRITAAWRFCSYCNCWCQHNCIGTAIVADTTATEFFMSVQLHHNCNCGCINHISPQFSTTARMVMLSQRRMQFKILPKPNKKLAPHELKNSTFVKFDKQIHTHKRKTSIM